MSKPSLLEVVVVIVIVVILVSLSLNLGDAKLEPATLEDLNDDRVKVIYIKPLFYKVMEE